MTQLQRRLRGDLLALYSFLKRGSGEASADLFSLGYRGVICGNGSKLHRGGSDWTLGRILPPRGWSNHGTGFLERQSMSQTFEVFKRRLDNASNNLFLVSPEVFRKLDWWSCSVLFCSLSFCEKQHLVWTCFLYSKSANFSSSSEIAIEIILSSIPLFPQILCKLRAWEYCSFFSYTLASLTSHSFLCASVCGFSSHIRLLLLFLIHYFIILFIISLIVLFPYYSLLSIVSSISLFNGQTKNSAV